MSNHRFDLKQTTRYEYGPYIIESHLIDTWQYRKYNKPHDWSRPHKSVMDCMNEIDKYETQLEHENAKEQAQYVPECEKEDLYERVNRHQVANEPVEPMHDITDKMLMLNSKLAGPHNVTEVMHLISIILSQIIREKL